MRRAFSLLSAAFLLVGLAVGCSGSPSTREPTTDPNAVKEKPRSGSASETIVP